MRYLLKAYTQVLHLTPPFHLPHRQIREAYRKNKDLIYQVLETHTEAPRHIAIAFLWQADELMLTSIVESKMRSLLHRIAEYIQKEYGNAETAVESAE